MDKRTHYTAEMKVKIVREHLENQVSMSDLCEKHGVHPNLFYKWKKELFEGAIETFSGKRKQGNKKEATRAKALEEKLKKKDYLIAELLEENISLKKNTSGEI